METKNKVKKTTKKSNTKKFQDLVNYYYIF